jgi:hypothetical protein
MTRKEYLEVKIQLDESLYTIDRSVDTLPGGRDEAFLKEEIRAMARNMRTALDHYYRNHKEDENGN